MDFIFIWFIIYYLGIGYISAQDYSLLIKDIYFVLFWAILVLYLKRKNKFNEYGLCLNNSQEFFKEKAIILAILVLPILNILFMVINGNMSNLVLSGKKIILNIIYILFSVMTEELLFRGVLISYFKDTFKLNLVISIIISAVLFSALHLLNGYTGNYLICQLFCAFTVGVCFGATYLYTGSIIPTVIVHSLINITSYMQTNETDLIQTILYIAAGLLYLFIGLYYIRKIRYKNETLH